jgi:hypothetical protein
MAAIMTERTRLAAQVLCALLSRDGWTEHRVDDVVALAFDYAARLLAADPLNAVEREQEPDDRRALLDRIANLTAERDELRHR